MEYPRGSWSYTVSAGGLPLNRPATEPPRDACYLGQGSQPAFRPVPLHQLFAVNWQIARHSYLYADWLIRGHDFRINPQDSIR